MENTPSDSDPTDKIEIYSTDDSRIKALGELLSTESGRKILNLVINQEMTASEIAKNVGISLELSRYHLQKMLQIGIIKISKIEKNLKEQDTKYYRSTRFVVMILPPQINQKAKESKPLLKSLSKLYKFMAIGLVSAVSWFFSYAMIPSKFTELKIPRDSGIVPENLFWSVTISLMIIIVGLVIERAWSRRKEKLF